MLQRVFGIKGTVPAKQLSGEVGVSFPLFMGREYRFLEGWNTFSGRIAVAASVGNVSGVRFRNPAGSNAIAVIEKLVYFTFPVANETPSINFLGPPTIDPGDIGGFVSNTLGLDGRTNAGNLPGRNNSCIISGKNNNPTTFGLTIMQYAVLSGQSLDLVFTDIQELPVTPGSMYDIYPSSLNQGLICSFLWRERQLEQSEVTQS
jgi:hypothetical protein